MYLKIDEKIMEEVRRVSIGNYEKEGDFYPEDSVIAIIENLLEEIDRINEEYEDYKNYVESNYKPMSYEEQIGRTD